MSRTWSCSRPPRALQVVKGQSRLASNGARTSLLPSRLWRQRPSKGAADSWPNGNRSRKAAPHIVCFKVGNDDRPTQVDKTTASKIAVPGHHHDDKDESMPDMLMQRAKEPFRDLPLSLTDVTLPALGALGAYGLADSHSLVTIGAGLAAGLLARGVQAFFLEQKVPFTGRRHTLLLPASFEVAMGAQTYSQLLASKEYSSNVLPEDHPDSKLVHRVAERIIAALGEGKGGGFQDHLQKFDWEVVVVKKDDVPNAFVLPGGKIVVFTGILSLVNRKEDLLAAIVGHEAAHALARHGAEKISLGLAVSLALQIVSFVLTQRAQRNGPQGQQQRGGGGYPGAGYPGAGYDGRGGGYGRGYPPGGYPRGYPPRGRLPYYRGMSAAQSAGPFGGGRRGPGGSLVDIAVNLFLQLPFSRRAEAEADLIGLKLMALAGYDIAAAPRTFELMEEFQKKKMGGAADMSYLQTHPRSGSRVKLLQQEVDRMKSSERAAENVLVKVPYWML